MANKLEIIEVKIRLADIYGGIIKFGMVASGSVAAFIATDRFFIHDSLANRFFIFLMSESIPLSVTFSALHRFSKIEKELSSFCGMAYGEIINKNMMYIIFIVILVIFCFVYFVG